MNNRFRSIGKRHQFWLMACVFVALQIFHVVIRKQNWILDVEWSISNYLSSMVLYGPLVSLVSAWKGSHDAKLHWLHRVNLYRTPVHECLKLTGVAVASFLFVLASILLFVTDWNGQTFSLEEARGIGVTCCAISGYVFFGWAWGYWQKTTWSWTVAGLVAFAATLILWINGFESVIRFDLGIAGPYLVTYNLNSEVVRIGFWMLVIFLSLLFAVGSRLDKISKSIRIVLSFSLIFILLTSLQLRNFDKKLKVWECSEGHIQVCLLQENGRFMQELEASISKSAIASQIGTTPGVLNRLSIDVVTPELFKPSQLDENLVMNYLNMTWPLCRGDEVEMYSLTEVEQDRVAQLHGWVLASVEPNYQDLARLDPALPRYPVGDKNSTSEFHRRIAQLPSC